MKILFLCSGNTCRSPMAEGIFKKILAENKDDYCLSNEGDNFIEISSAGFSTYSGEKADEYAILVCKKKGIDLSDFKTTNIKDIDFNDIDLVLTATSDNMKKLNKIYPNVKAYTIKQFAGDHENPDIKDPDDGGLGDYVLCYFELKDALEKIAKRLFS